MIQYDPADPKHEVLLLQWWAALMESGEINTVFDARYHRVSEFFIAFRQDVLLLETDEKGIWFAAWFDKSPLDGAFFSLWLRPDHRQSKASLAAITSAIGIGFHDLKFRAILVVTNTPSIAKLHQRYGFTRLGVVPGLYHGSDAIVSFMTDDMFDRIGATEERPDDEPPLSDKEFVLNGR